MYRQGLGDCFLLRFPGLAGKPFHMLIDSGVIKGTSEPSVIMREVAQDIQNETGGKIDVLVVTHEHWDHVSGFTEARDIWSQLEIAEVWLSWTEDPTNDLANKLRKERADKKAQIAARLAKFASSPTFHLDRSRVARVEALLGFMGFGLAATEGDVGGTKEALDYISGRGKKVTFQKENTTFVRKEIPGVRVYVLGPPEDEVKIKRSDPSKANPEVYLESGPAFAFGATQLDTAEEDYGRPFPELEGKALAKPEDYDTALAAFFPTLSYPDPAWRRLSFDSIAEIERLALALDSDTNNTSLVLAFELADGRVLLFPADAQVGNWLSWQDCEWKVGTKSIKANDLLARTVLYKVGHHGSHNATLKELGLEKMTHRDLIAFVPVNKAMAVKKKWKMPFEPLRKRLVEKTQGRLVLADNTVSLPSAADLTGLTPAERKRFAETVTADDLFIDLTVPL
jgi:hypothetical protein